MSYRENMPAKNLHRLDGEKTYSHIYNKGIEERIIFNDKEDYETFLGYLRDYLSPPPAPEHAKKEFTVNGRIFRGVPHQPKNYEGKVDLIAYSLEPSRFHLLLRQLTTGSLEKFMRSLSTRYSMYFNKKYQRTGTLFQGPYKSAQVKDTLSLLLLSKYFHRGKNDYSSFKEFAGAKDTSWVKPQTVLSFFEKTKSTSFRGLKSYQDFIEGYKPDQKEREALEKIIPQRVSEPLEGRDLPLARSTFFDQKDQHPHLKPLSRIPELIGLSTVFLLLLSIGTRNVVLSTSPSPQVSGVEDEVGAKRLIVKNPNGLDGINIREKPSADSKKIGEAIEGDTFEYLSFDSGWYEVKLTDGATGFISASFIEVIIETIDE